MTVTDFETVHEFGLDTSPPLLGAGDRPAYDHFNPKGGAPILLICDHASPAVPASLGALGLDRGLFERHIAFDIGAAELTRKLAPKLGAQAILSGYSRLLIDCNRAPGDPESVPEASDGVAIPGNRELGEGGQERRVEAFFWPYHHAVTNALAGLWRAGKPPALFSVHSFTPRLNGLDRQWDIGVLWHRDRRMAVPLIEILRARDDLVVGDNLPYSGHDIAYSIDLHAGSAGLPHVAVEIRQDHLETAPGIARWTDILGRALSEVLAIDDLHRVEHF